ncbi:bifunctional [glutamate--ammonia ligase]-adenylyl-L-tyrosine phosphorylase/[glutamate--ammonia-ligase] adenylyltransferase [Agaribacterium haliotis]|uniref:bifunctional [glutamate--ammonia ligase]-adenylyl-L-tyrosine phosphorylase/[glutamate--ammonia-ligase] adenylyltransferase n=1 Tax=Agaribacterium haliotis TaxID=2013869 RepID=UPI000BB55A72|nr:bifunctional [glutamate--ammonia ligase]-adenylyl-L-tyrosine phosphorylase/[glutamate--ammonia-ligase] adenylyltransferase [Agaribacterium haliotis]
MASANLSSLPEKLRQAATIKLDIEQQQQLEQRLNKQISSELQATLRVSQFAERQLERRPEFLLQLLQHCALGHKLERPDYAALMQTFVGEEDFDNSLRRWRQLMMLRLIWREANKRCELFDSTKELSWMAELACQSCLERHYQALVSNHGVPRNSRAEQQHLYVLGMGKLGAWELNLSSDIDLIFAYPDKGQCDGKQKLDNQEFFTRLGKRIIQSLDQVSAEGRVFRVDMRLRPWGQSGALVSSFAALDTYYQSQGREWERYAMIKARVVAAGGDGARSEELMSTLRSFSYRKYIDYSVIEALRDLKQKIRQEVRRRRLEHDVKLGAGGIREIEFIAQVFQLIRGGRDTQLQSSEINKILPELEKLHLLPRGKAQALLQAYIFLRQCEHGIQAWNDEQSQQLPDSDEARKALLSWMAFSDWQSFEQALQQQRQLVSEEFEVLIADGDQEHRAVHASDWAVELWHKACDGLCSLDGGLSCEALQEFSLNPAVVSLSPDSRERLDAFMPILLSELNSFADSQTMLLRILPLVRAVIRRSAYLVLLMENPSALKLLLQLSEASAQIVEQLSKHPALLDELLDTHSLYHLPKRDELSDELRRTMLRIDENDLEAQMEALRYFKLSHSLRIAACEVNGILPLMKVSDYLTWLAEALVDHCLGLAWQAMIKRHGYPDNNSTNGPDFAVIAYGKLGGIELNHGSDLDLVFMHDANIHGETGGPRSIDNATFYMRLGQKLIHLIDTRTHSGRLYEIDMRLRPSGESGPLVASFSAFERYQSSEAWTWEHQALVRARAIAGSRKLAERFDALRRQILCRKRDLTQLRKDIVEMREKMRKHLGSKASEADVFHLKQDAGGIVDIEFMVQYLVLAWSHANPSLATWTDNIRILEALAQADNLSTQEVEELSAAYKALRVVMHRQTIEEKSNKVSADALINERNSVTAIWQRLLGEA